MANLMDYLTWRGDLDMGRDPWNHVDALAMANLCYLDFQGISDERGWPLAEARKRQMDQVTAVANYEGRYHQFLAMAETRRFGVIRMHHFLSLTDEEEGLQFSATCYDLPDGTLCIGFRGTDGTFVGWREDFNMSFQTTVPAQEAAVLYLARAAEMDSRPIRLVGHSKGGNLAVYAAARSVPEVQDRLLQVYSFDGPGMDQEIFDSEGYARVADRICSFVPQSSIVGMLMAYYPKYTVVKSSASGIAQHDPLTWMVQGAKFETMEKIDKNAETISDTLHDLLKKTNRGERAAAVNALFGILENTQVSTFSEMKGEWLRSITGVAQGTRDLSSDARKAVTKLVGLFLSQGFGNLAEKYRVRSAERKSGEKKPPERDGAETGNETPNPGLTEDSME
ncbi:MAG: DUF2974 domain-containing protein [Clostridia bacterium]|nr:DUF2974 domain-containing protein [Clostridia bacterium]